MRELDVQEHEIQGPRQWLLTNVSRMVTAQKKMDMNLCGYSQAESMPVKNFLKKKGIDYARPRRVTTSRLHCR